MRDYVDVVGRLQFYEFLDIIPYTTLLKRINISHKHQGAILKDNQELYKLDDFLEILATDDERVRDKLESDYRNVLHKSFNVSYTLKTRGRPQLVYTSDQHAKEIRDRIELTDLKKLLKSSNDVVTSSKNSRAITKPKLPNPPIEDGLIIAPNRLPEIGKNSDVTRVQVANRIVTESDVHHQENLMRSLQWDIINNDEKYRQLMEKKVEEIKNRKKYRENRNITTIHIPTGSHVRDYVHRTTSRPSTINKTFGSISRPSTINCALFTDSEEEESPRTVSTPQKKDILTVPVSQPLDLSYEYRRNKILEKVKLVKSGKRLIDI